MSFPRSRPEVVSQREFNVIRNAEDFKVDLDGVENSLIGEAVEPPFRSSLNPEALRSYSRQKANTIPRYRPFKIEDEPVQVVHPSIHRALARFISLLSESLNFKMAPISSSIVHYPIIDIGDSKDTERTYLDYHDEEVFAIKYYMASRDVYTEPNVILWQRKALKYFNFPMFALLLALSHCYGHFYQIIFDLRKSTALAELTAKFYHDLKIHSCTMEQHKIVLKESEKQKQELIVVLQMTEFERTSEMELDIPSNQLPPGKPFDEELLIEAHYRGDSLFQFVKLVYQGCYSKPPSKLLPSQMELKSLISQLFDDPDVSRAAVSVFHLEWSMSGADQLRTFEIDDPGFIRIIYYLSLRYHLQYIQTSRTDGKKVVQKWIYDLIKEYDASFKR